MKHEALRGSAADLARPLFALARRALLLVCVAGLVFGASGCVTTEERGGSAGLFRPQDPYCDAEYNELKKFDDVFQKSLAAGAIAAGAAGLATGDWRIALAAFVVTSLTTSYLVTLEKQKEAERRDLYLQDVNGENQVIDGATAAFNTLAECRFAAAKGVRTAWQAGRTSKAQASQQMAQLSELFQWDLKLGRKMQVRINDRGEQFANASSLAAGSEPETRALPALPAAPATTSAASGEMRETHTWSNVRSGPGTSHSKVATLEPRKPVELIGPADGAPAWSHIRLEDGREAYIANTLLVMPGAQPAAKSKPASPTSVAGVTQSNQVKRQAFASSIDEADQSSRVAFDLDADEQLGHRGTPGALARS